ncbi:hypothetical protein KG090_00650 [Carnobacteriaceae bacterium zg-ZUI240]|nr:hypothetical protein [Carnobacteriaceae bacterium zg-ZUI240]
MKSDTEKTREVALDNRNGLKHTQRYRLQKDVSEAVERGYTTIHEVQELTALYDSYHRLGGNGVIDTLFSKFQELTIKKEN